MTNPLAWGAADGLTFLLILFRIGGALLTAPVLGTRSAPIQLKVGLALAISFLLYPAVGRAPALPADLGAYFLAALAETAVGAVMGFTASLIFSAVQFAGSLVDREIGLGLANVIDPISNEEVSLLGQLQFLLATLVFLGVNGHLHLIDAIAGSFQRIPLLGLTVGTGWMRFVSADLGAYVFVAAIKIGAPSLVALFFITIVMGFLARAVPEMNVFVLGFALRIAVGFLVLALSTPVFVDVVAGMEREMFGHLDRVVEGMAGR